MNKLGKAHVPQATAVAVEFSPARYIEPMLYEMQGDHTRMEYRSLADSMCLSESRAAELFWISKQTSATPQNVLAEGEI